MASINPSTVTSCTIAVALKFVGQDLRNLMSWLPEARRLGFEVIIVQDNFSEDSQALDPEQLEYFNSLGVRYFIGKFGNPGSARNVALEAAVKEWVVFWDSDDIGYPMLLAYEIELASQENADALVCPFNIFDETTEKFTKTYLLSKQTNLQRELLLRPGIWRIAFRRQLLTHQRFPCVRMAEDQYFIANSGIFESRVRIAETVTYTYFYGGPGHLVNENSAISDMKITILQLELNLQTKRAESNSYSQSIILKQLITCLKRGDIKLKAWASKHFISNLAKRPRTTIKTTLIIIKG
jgi:glycosyltransferase involved in cell wall biosynthesis